MEKPHIEKITVKEGDKEQEVVIAMTDKESRDGDYKEELRQRYEEKTREELRNSPPTNPEKKERARERMVGELKEYQEWKSRRDSGDIRRKFF